ncbi:DNRLRE domain-containing protein [Spongiibacter taiwanensis]
MLGRLRLAFAHPKHQLPTRGKVLTGCNWLHCYVAGALFKRDVSSVPAGVAVTAASITVRVYNQTNSVYGFWEMQGAWNEAGVTWNNAQPLSNRGDQVGSFSPTSQGGYTINLNADGVALVHRWIDSGVNDGVLIQSGGTNNGIDMRSSEYGTQNQRPTLTISYQ